MSQPQQIVVVGNGMVGHKLVEELVGCDLHRRHRITILGEEPRPAYDRVHLSAWFGGTNADGSPQPATLAEAYPGLRVVNHEWADPDMLVLAHDELNVIRRVRDKITRPKGRT